MKQFIILAKISLIFVWLILMFNILHPFPGVGAMALYIMTGFLLCMHGLQMLIFIGAFGDKIAITRWDKWSILIFGVFALLDIRQKHMIEK